MTRLVATSVVRGSCQGESHGGVYVIDLDARRAVQVIDWNTPDIDWTGRGWDRGLRGVAFGKDEIFIAASDELFAFDKSFNRTGGWRHPALKHAHEISRHGDMIYIVSTGHDAVLGFDITNRTFTWGLRLTMLDKAIRAEVFDPADPETTPARNDLHLNSVFADEGGLYLGGLHSLGLLRWRNGRLSMICSLPPGTHNARPHRDGALFNDTPMDMVRFVSPSRQRTFSVPTYGADELTHVDVDDTRLARQAFGRGLCLVEDGLVAAGSSPSTIALHDLDANRTRLQITLSRDVRNAVHGLAVWPFA